MANIVLAALSTGIEGGFSVIYDIPQDLWDSVSQIFDVNNVNKLLKQISNDEDASVHNMSAVEAKAAAVPKGENGVGGTSAADFRTFNVAKELGADVEVTFGGLTWHAVYLSQTGKDGDENRDVILTLWMADSTQLSGETYADGKAFDEKGTSTWNIVLNNGGGYITSQSATELTQAHQIASSVFAKFTMKDFGLTQYLVTPEEVMWQKEGQSILLFGRPSYNCPNENWSNDVPDDGFYTPDFNYVHKSGNDAWKNDYLWLPSLSETGENDNYNGIWETSQNQRKNGTTFSWLRTGYESSASTVYSLTTSNWHLNNVHYTHAVRPALHLNLTEVAKSLKQ